MSRSIGDRLRKFLCPASDIDNEPVRLHGLKAAGQPRAPCDYKKERARPHFLQQADHLMVAKVLHNSATARPNLRSVSPRE
jgi:hypothetical protein